MKYQNFLPEGFKIPSPIPEYQPTETHDDSERTEIVVGIKKATREVSK